MLHFIKSNKNINLRVAANHDQINIRTIFLQLFISSTFWKYHNRLLHKGIDIDCPAYNTYEFA